MNTWDEARSSCSAPQENQFDMDMLFPESPTPSRASSEHGDNDHDNDRDNDHDHRYTDNDDHRRIDNDHRRIDNDHHYTDNDHRYTDNDHPRARYAHYDHLDAASDHGREYDDDDNNIDVDNIDMDIEVGHVYPARGDSSSYPARGDVNGDGNPRGLSAERKHGRTSKRGRAGGNGGTGMGADGVGRAGSSPFALECDEVGDHDDAGFDRGGSGWRGRGEDPRGYHYRGGY